MPCAFSSFQVSSDLYIAAETIISPSGRWDSQLAKERGIVGGNDTWALFSRSPFQTSILRSIYTRCEMRRVYKR